jgi:hypothetical protein
MNSVFAAENPFSARRISPGAVSYVFPAGENPETLVERLRQAGWWGEIVGPHGSGKSTLLAALMAAIQRAGHQTVLIALHDGEHRLPPSVQCDPRLRSPMVLVVDGYEQLSRWSRFTLKRSCRRQRLGLLVTAHKSVGLPHLYQTAVRAEVGGQVVDLVLAGRQPPFGPEEVSRCLARHGGNLREALFELYDLFEGTASSGQNVT